MQNNVRQTRTIRQRAWNTVRGTMQSQAIKDEELFKSAKNGDYNRVVKYLNRGAKITQGTFYGNRQVEGIIKRIWFNPRNNRSKEQVINDLKIFKLLAYAYDGDERDKYIDISRILEQIFKYAEQVERMRGRGGRADVGWWGSDGGGLIIAREAAEIAAEAETREVWHGGWPAAAAVLIENGEELEEAASFAAIAAREGGTESQVAQSRETLITVRRRTRLQDRQRRHEQREQRMWEELERHERRQRLQEEEALQRYYEGRRRAGLRVPPAATIRGEAFHVHRETEKFSEKVPVILQLIKKDIGNKEYNNIEQVFKPLTEYLEGSPVFESKEVQTNDATKILSRAEWIQDLNKIKTSMNGSANEKIVHIGLIFDFVIKYKEITDCFIVGFVYDCTHAYNNSKMSCYKGIIERTVSTLINCIKGMNEGVFGELNEIIENNIKSWDDLDKAKQAAYILTWNNFLLNWSNTNKENEGVKAMTPGVRSEAAMTDFKKQDIVPKYVEDHIRSELLPGLTTMWEDYGFNSPSGGRYRKKTRKNTKKSKRTRRR